MLHKILKKEFQCPENLEMLTIIIIKIDIFLLTFLNKGNLKFYKKLNF
jgi:hypothetical protein